MASKFWQGFAGTMGGIMDERRMSEMEMQKQRALKELEKEFGMEIVDPGLTSIEGNVEVRYNKYGTKISERPLSPEEIEARQADLNKTKADARRAVTEADISDKKFSTYDEDRKLALDEADSIRKAREAGTAQGWARINLEKERLSPNLDTAVNEVITALRAVDGEAGISSAKVMEESFLADLERAPDDAAKARVIAAWKGRALNLDSRQKHSRALESRGGGSLQDYILGLQNPSRP